MKNSFRILFYTKRKEKLKNGRMPIMCKISVNGKFCTFSTALSVEDKMWDQHKKRMTGRGEEARRINGLLDRIYYAVYDAYMQIQRSQEEVTPQAVRSIYTGQQNNSTGIVEFFRRHNDEFAQMVGINRSKSTLYKYRYVCKHLHRHIFEHYGLTDIPVTKVDRRFIRDFHKWLADTAKCSVNTIWIYMIAFKHVILQAVASGIITRNPFVGYKLHCRQPDKSFLMSDELQRFLEYKPDSLARCMVIDAFIFSCFTGLSFADVKRLTMSDIVLRNNRYYVSTHRTKTGSSIDVPLLQLPYSLIRKHYTPDSARIFTLPANGRCNAVIRSVAADLGISKRVTFHTARHTFATTVTLANGIPIEVVSRMLGHVNIKTTQIYARVLQTSIATEMSRASKSIESSYRIPERLLSYAVQCTNRGNTQAP